MLRDEDILVDLAQVDILLPNQPEDVPIANPVEEPLIFDVILYMLV